MSARYSSSPTLRLAIADSRYYHYLLLSLALAVFFALVLLYQRGYPQLAWPLLPLAAIALWRQYVQRPRGWVLHWSQGDWWLESEGSINLVELKPQSACLSWVTLLVFTRLPQGRCQRAWIFADACDSESLRRLRVRLTLQC